MKKKIIEVVLLMTIMVLPCFAEIRVDRGGYSEGGIACNTAYYWNDKNDNPIVNANEESRFVVRNLKGLLKGIYIGTAHIYIFHGVLYKVVHVQTDYNFQVAVICQYENGYNESLYGNAFYSANTAKAQFDALCQQYYNKIAK